MPRKRELRRTRGRVVTALAGGIAVLLGAGELISVPGDVHQPGGAVELASGFLLVLIGAAAGTWALRTVDGVSRLERKELLARGADDGLPWGAFREGQRIGLEASDFWLLLSGLMLGVGLVFFLSGVADAQVGWRVAAAISLVGFVPAALCLRLGTGVPYWLTAEGVVRRTRTRPSVLWAEVERIVPVFRGAPVDRRVANAFELQVTKPQRGLRRWLGDSFTINVALLEIDSQALSELLDARLPTHVPRESDSQTTEEQ